MKSDPFARVSFRVYMVNEATQHATSLGTYPSLAEAAARVDAERLDRVRSFVRYVAIGPTSAVVELGRGRAA